MITGASKGIGAASAKLFAKKGWDLLLVSRSESQLESLSNSLASTGSKVIFKSIDFSKPDQIAPGLAELLGEGCIPSVLINNAGVAWTGELLSMTLSEWNWLFQMNLTSVFQVCSEVIPSMREKGGLVINVSSHAAHKVFPQWGAYCISKSALSSFTKSLAEEERLNGIRACTITLGSVNTTLWDSKTVDADFDRESMLNVDNVASELFHLAEQPSSQIIEDIILMPAIGSY